MSRGTLVKLGLFGGGFSLHSVGEAGKKRIDAPGALPHIVLRGMDRRKIFRVNRYREDSLARLGIIVGMTGVGR
jgi:hypothetical protein